MSPQQQAIEQDQVKIEILTYWDSEFRDDIFNPPQYPYLLEEVFVSEDEYETRKLYKVVGIEYAGNGQDYLYILRPLKVTGQINWSALKRTVEEEKIITASAEILSSIPLKENEEDYPF
ncbi:MAG: hypothetical protein SVX43_13540 [Cyanobacteriota bacterium]|nr:hypothetical protein [Cyanobacteriota bacterium]